MPEAAESAARQVLRWLQERRLEECYELLAREGYADLRAVLQLREAELAEMGFPATVGRRLLQAIDDMERSPALRSLAFRGVYSVHADSLHFRGLLHALGTRFGLQPWANPLALGVVEVTASSVRSGSESQVVDCDFVDQVFFTLPYPRGQWVVVQLKGFEVRPTAYAMAHRAGIARYFMRNWTFEGRGDGQAWHVLRSHHDDPTLNPHQPRATWGVEAAEFFSAFRVRMLPAGNDQGTGALVLSCFELFGDLRPSPASSQLSSMSKQVGACRTSSPPPSQPSAEVPPRRPSTSSSPLPASAAASSSRSLGQRYPPRCRLSRQMLGSARDPQAPASAELPRWTPPPVVVDIYGSDLECWLHAAAPAEGFGDRAATPPSEQRAASPPPSTTSAAESRLPGDHGRRRPPNAPAPGGTAAPAEGGGDRTASPPFERRTVSPTAPHTPGGACAEGTHPTLTELTEGAAAVGCGSTEGNHTGECPEPSSLGLSQRMLTADDEDRNHLVALLAGAPMMGPTAP
eukprot:EG_transcript_9446